MCIGSKPKMPDPQPVILPPTPAAAVDPAVVGARDAADQGNRQRTGLAGTRLTAGLGGTGTEMAKKLSGK